MKKIIGLLSIKKTIIFFDARIHFLCASLLAVASLSSCGDDGLYRIPFPENDANTYSVNNFIIDNKFVDLYSLTPLSDISLGPIVYVSFSRRIPSESMDSVRKYLTLTRDADGSAVPISIYKAEVDSFIIIALPASITLEKQTTYTFQLKKELSLSEEGKKVNLDKNYLISFTTIKKSERGDLRVRYLGKDVLPNNAGAFIINLPIAQKVPGKIDIILRVPSFAKLYERSTLINPARDTALPYIFNFNTKNETVPFTVEAENGTKRTYQVIVRIPSTSDKIINSFGFTVADNYTLSADALGVITGTSIVVSLPAGTSVKALKPTINYTGKSISPANRATQDFSLPINYVVTAEDGSIRMYNVKVMVEVQYILTFNSNGGSSVSSQVLKQGVKPTKPNDPTKTDSVFAGWFVDNGTFNKALNFNDTLKSDITVYAKWGTRPLNATDTFTITFETNGGSPISRQKLRKVLNKPTRPSDPTKTDSLFDDWFVDNGTFMNPFIFTDTITMDKTIYAKWKAKPLTAADTVTLSFATNGAAPIGDQKIRKGEKGVKPSDPVRRKIFFLGWYSDPGLKTQFIFDSPIRQNTTAYAKWAIKTLPDVIQEGIIPKNVSGYDPAATDVLQPFITPNNPPIVIKRMHVKKGGTGDGSSWSKAKNSLQDALNAMPAVLPAGEVYFVMMAASNQEYREQNVIHFTKENVAIIGGFNAKSDSDYTLSSTDRTILSGAGRRRIFYIDNNSAKPVGPTTMLYGLKLIDGRADVSGNLGLEGGAIKIKGSSPTIINVIFSNNTADIGGAVHIEDGSAPTFKNVVFENNTASSFGGGVAIEQSKPSFVNTTFKSNTVTAGRGGAVYIQSGVAINSFADDNTIYFIYTTFADNSAPAQPISSSMYVTDEKSAFQVYFASSLFGKIGGVIQKQILLDNRFSRSNNLFSTYLTILPGGPDNGAELLPGWKIGFPRFLDRDPLLGTYGAHGSLIPTVEPTNSSIVSSFNGSRIKFDYYPSGSTPNDRISFRNSGNTWGSFNRFNPFIQVNATPSATAVEIDTDARGYYRDDAPDLGAHEVGATP